MGPKPLLKMVKILNASEDLRFIRQLFIIVYLYLKERGRLPKKIECLYHISGPAEADNP